MTDDKPRKGTCSVCRAPATYYGETTQYCISDYAELEKKAEALVEALKKYAKCDNVKISQFASNGNELAALTMGSAGIDISETSKKALADYRAEGGNDE